jgi:hypothetical protein
MKNHALVCVIGWLAFWTFGAIALFANSLSDQHIIIAAMLAFGGIMAGMTSYLKLSREYR